MSPKRILLVFLQEPIAGQVKLQLAKSCGDEEANTIYQSLVAVQLRQLKGLENCDIRFCYTPADAHDSIKFWILPQLENLQVIDDHSWHWPQSSSQLKISFHPQAELDFDHVVNHALTDAFTDGYDEVAVMTSDCPMCGSRWVQLAFSMLQKHELSIGPTPAGGCHLVATKKAPNISPAITWDSCDQTADSARLAGYKHALLPELAEVSEFSDWENILESPLGAALIKAHKNLSGRDHPLPLP